MRKKSRHRARCRLKLTRSASFETGGLIKISDSCVVHEGVKLLEQLLGRYALRIK